MSEAWSGTLTIAVLIAALAVVHVPLGHLPGAGLHQ